MWDTTALCYPTHSSMMRSSNGNTFRVTGLLCGEFTGDRWIPLTKASDTELWCFFDLRLFKRLSKHSWGWWFESVSRSVWRHHNKNSAIYRSTWFSRWLAYIYLWHTKGTNLHRLISAAIGRWVTSDPAESPFLPGRKKLCTNAVEYDP